LIKCSAFLLRSVLGGASPTTRIAKETKDEDYHPPHMKHGREVCLNGEFIVWILEV
jgi:hypothetical protein